MVINHEDIILNCYRLAHHYNQNPEVFTEMTLSRLGYHIYYTNRLIELREAEKQRQQDNDA